MFDTGRPARVESFVDATDELGAAIHQAGFRSAVGAPIVVDGRLWGVMTASSRTEVPPEDLFAAVVDEVGQLLSVDLAAMGRYESDGSLTFVATRGIAGGDPRKAGIRASVTTPIVFDGRRWGVIAAGSAVERALPDDIEVRLSSFTELVATAIANAESRAAVLASRARIVAAADESRRRIERDLHDGAQQRLVHAVIVLKLALRALSAGDANAGRLLAEALAHSEQATAELRELAHGILPAVLSRGGLRAGIDALVSRASLPVSVDVVVGRLPADVEATAYFVVREALANVVKHARANSAEVRTEVDGGQLRVEVRDDGVGGAQGGDGTGLGGLADRVSAVGGRLAVDGPPGGGTCVCALLPIPAEL